MVYIRKEMCDEYGIWATLLKALAAARSIQTIQPIGDIKAGIHALF
jgi:hypothetical protein